MATDGDAQIFAACSTGALPSTGCAINREQEQATDLVAGALVKLDCHGTVTTISSDGWGANLL